MLLRASILALVMGTIVGGCGLGPPGKVKVDTPILPYQAPDVAEISGVDEDEEDDDDATEEPAGTGAATEAPKK